MSTPTASFADEVAALIASRPPCPACAGSGRADGAQLLAFVAGLIGDAFADVDEAEDELDELFAGLDVP